MANETRLGSVIRVGISTSKAKLRIPRVGCGHVASPSSEISLCLEAGGLSISISTANVGELIADAVHDDGRVERLLLTLVDKRVDGLECELGVLATVKPSLVRGLVVKT